MKPYIPAICRSLSLTACAAVYAFSVEPAAATITSEQTGHLQMQTPIQSRFRRRTDHSKPPISRPQAMHVADLVSDDRKRDQFFSRIKRQGVF